MVLQLNPEGIKKFRKYLLRILPLALVIYFTWKILPLFHRPQYGFYFERTIDSIISIWLIDLTIHNKSKWLKDNVFENRFLNLVGKISYGLYLFHYPFHPFYLNLLSKIAIRVPMFSALFKNFLFVNISALLALFTVAYLSFELLEKRITGIKKNFTYNKKSPS
jgi:hypothetical protein